MIMIMTCITMGGNYDLKAVAPEFFGEGNADVVCRICIYFIVSKIPSIFNLGLICRLIFEIERRSRLRPLVDRKFG